MNPTHSASSLWTNNLCCLLSYFTDALFTSAHSSCYWLGSRTVTENLYASTVSFSEVFTYSGKSLIHLSKITYALHAYLLARWPLLLFGHSSSRHTSTLHRKLWHLLLYENITITLTLTQTCLRPGDIGLGEAVSEPAISLDCCFVNMVPLSWNHRQ